MLGRFGLGPLELDVLQRLWALETASVRDIYKIFLKEGREIAYSTVLTVMKNLEYKDVLQHTVEGRTFYYTVKMPEKKIKRDVIGYLFDKVFYGDAEQFGKHFAEYMGYSPKDAEALCGIIQASDRRALKRKSKK